MSETVKINGQHYKLGFNDWVFVLRDNEWVRAQHMTPGEVRHAIKAHESHVRSDNRKKSDMPIRSKGRKNV